MKRRSVRLWATDALGTCGMWTPIILTCSVAVGVLTLILLAPTNPAATTEVGFASDAEMPMDAATSQSIVEHVQDPAFDEQINEALERSGVGEDAKVSASSEPGATTVEIRGSAADSDVADEASLLAADAAIFWFGTEGDPRPAELTIVSVQRAEPSSPAWPAALTLTLTIFAFSMVMVIAARKPQRRLRFSRDLAPAHRDVPVIGGAETAPGATLRNTTAVLSRIGRPEDGYLTVVAVTGIDQPPSARLIDVLERRLATIDSSVRPQAVRGISENITRFNAVLLTCPTVIAADRVSDALDMIASHQVKAAGVLLGEIDTIEAQSEPPRVATSKKTTPNVEVVITEPSD